MGSMEVIAASNAGGSGALPAPPPSTGPAGYYPGGVNMPFVKAIFEFLGQDGDTWTEDWWTNAGSVSGVTGTPKDILNARLALLADAHEFTRVRWVQDDAARAAVPEDVFLPGENPTGSTGLAPVGLAAVIGLRLTDGSTRHWWLRGLRDNDFVIDAQGNQGFWAGYSAKLSTFVAALANNTWGVRRMDPVKLRPPNVTNIVSVDGSTTPGMSLVTCATPHLLKIPSEIKIYRTNNKDLPSLQGHWFVAALGSLPTTFLIPYRTPRDEGPIWTAGFIRTATYSTVTPFSAPDSSKLPITPRLLHIAHHDTKTALFGSRGARHAQRLRQSL
jgi:hypothetical protein